MTVLVRIPTPMRSATDGEAELSLDASTVGQLIADLEQRYPGMQGRLRDDTGELRRFVNVYLNGEDVRFKDGLRTSLQAGDELSIVPAVAGG